MINHLTFEKIFYYLSAFFISFFVLFAFVIYPNIHIFHVHPDNLAGWMERYPHFKWYISLVGNWGYIVYYSFAELWPNIFYVLLFWHLYILWTGVTIMVMTIIGNNVMRMHNWFVAAVISPIIIMVTGILFFTLIVFDQQILSLFDGAILMSPLALA
ncbi:unnamed protein product, partial [Ixodes persulcatus]